MAKNIVELTDENFEREVLQSDIPALVDFWAPWCGPCMALSPTIEKIAGERAGDLKVCKLNVDVSPEIAAKYGIRSIPTIVIFRGGNAAGQLTGTVAKQQLDAMIDAA